MTKQAPKRDAAPRPEYLRLKALRHNSWGEISTSHLPPVAPVLKPGQAAQSFPVHNGSALKYRSVIVSVGPKVAPDADQVPRSDAEIRAEVVEKLLRAGETCRLSDLPAEVRALTKVVQTQEFVQAIAEIDKDMPARRRPTAAELTEYEEVLAWLLQLEPAKRYIISATMFGVGVRRIATLTGQKRGTVDNRKNEAIRQIVGWVKSGRT